MTTLDMARARQVLQDLTDPYTGQSLGAADAVQSVAVAEGGAVQVALRLGYPASGAHTAAGWRGRVAQALAPLAGEHPPLVSLTLTHQVTTHAAKAGLALLPGVKNIIAVASGKGGVGKSTTAANVAVALAAEGAQVGLLDADIYGPSLPLMLGLAGQRPASPDGKTMQPLRAHGVAVNSIGFLVPDEDAVIWRGPMAVQAMDQLLRLSNWGELDYLIVDMPPGTGDIQLSLAQRVPVTGAVIVTTPQDIALADARKGLAMFEKVLVPLLGVVENMAVYHCPACGHAEHLFGQGGGAALAEATHVPHLGALPLLRSIREHADSGTPIVVAKPDSAEAGLYREVALRIAGQLARLTPAATRFPTISISKAT